MSPYPTLSPSMMTTFGLSAAMAACVISVRSAMASLLFIGSSLFAGAERDRKSQPAIPAFGAMFRTKFEVAAQADIALALAHRKEESGLRTHRIGAGFEIAEHRARTTVTTQLIVDIANEPDVPGLVEELRQRPVDVSIHAVLVVSVIVLEVVGQAPDDGKLVTFFWIEVGVPAAGVYRPVIHAKICQFPHFIGADRNSAHQVGHRVMDTFAPLDRTHGIQVRHAGQRIGTAHCYRIATWARQRGVSLHAHVPSRDGQRERALPSKDRVGKRISGCGKHEICLRVEPEH